jgi:hypothetical protein
MTTCPACGAKFKTGAEPIEPEEGSFDSPPAMVAVTVSKRKRVVNFIVGFLAFFGVLLFIAVIYAFVETAKEEIEAGGSYSTNEAYREEGHKPEEVYTGDITLSMDISDYSVITWSEEPKLQWGETEWNSDMLMIHAKIHNNGERDISYLSFSFDIVWETNDEPKYASASVRDLFAGQDEYLTQSVYIYLPKTYGDIKEIKLTEVRVQYD